MKNIDIPNTHNEVIIPGESSVTIELGKSGYIDIKVKAGTDCDNTRLSFLREKAIEQFKEILDDEEVKKYVKQPKQERLIG